MHPQPHAGESLTSWISRLASSNVSTLRSLLSSYLGEGDWRRRDLDLLGANALTVLACLGRVQGGTTTLRRMVLGPWEDLILPKDNIMDRKGWVSSHSLLRYCPKCLAEDSIPHLRLLWRLHFVPVCPAHGTVLQNGCWRCRSESTINVRIEEESVVCSKCGSSLADATVVKPRNCERVVRFSSSVVKILDDRKIPEDYQWPLETDEFFRALLAIVRYFNLYLQREPCWIDLLKEHDLSPDPPLEWRRNDAIACVLLEKSLGLMGNWPCNLSEFVRENEARFNRLRVEYGRYYPRSLKVVGEMAKKRGADKSRLGVPLRKHQTIADNDALSGHARSEGVKNAVDHLVQSDAAVSLRAVSRLTRVSFQNLKEDATLNAIIQEGKDNLKIKQEANIRKAVTVLRDRGIEVTVASVATYLGRSYRYLRSPNLLGLILSAKAQP